MLEQGSLIDGRYEVEALIGEGGLAQVYRVRHKALGSVHALKLLSWRKKQLAERLLTEGRIQAHMRRLAWPFALATVGFMAAVSLWTPFLDIVYFERWFTWPKALYTGLVPALVALCILGLFRGLQAHRDVLPFMSALGLFVFGFIGIGISFYPKMVPPSLTIVDAAAPDSSLRFALVGAAVLLPIILAYTAYAYWVFRGKIDPEEGYH